MLCEFNIALFRFTFSDLKQFKVSSFIWQITDKIVKPQLDLQTHVVYKAIRKRLELKVNSSLNAEFTNECS